MGDAVIEEFFDHSAAVRDLAVSVGVIVGVWFAFIRSNAADRQAQASREQAILGRREHVTELFNKATEQLYSPHLAVRLGSVYTLERIVEEFTDFDFRIYEIFAARIREGHGGDATPEVQEMVDYLILQDRSGGDSDDVA